jgi:hypothetical protein
VNRFSVLMKAQACVPALIALCACAYAEAVPPAAKAIQKEAEKIREVLQANFQATNEENLPALMDTIGRTMAGRQQFEIEAKKMFEDTDVYLRLEDFQLIQFSPPFAAVRVVQVTLPRDEKDREAQSGPRQAYRGNSALLPEWERCVYTQTFHKSNGKWKLYLITDRPREFLLSPHILTR